MAEQRNDYYKYNIIINKTIRSRQFNTYLMFAFTLLYFIDFLMQVPIYVCNITQVVGTYMSVIKRCSWHHILLIFKIDAKFTKIVDMIHYCFYIREITQDMPAHKVYHDPHLRTHVYHHTRGNFSALSLPTYQQCAANRRSDQYTLKHPTQTPPSPVKVILMPNINSAH